MRYFRFDIVIQREPDDEGYYAFSPALPGCFSNGKTIDETRRNMREAIQLHVESLLAHGDEVPQESERVQVEELTIAIPA